MTKGAVLSTGVPSLDRVLRGGFQWGMHVVLSGEVGSGLQEFVRNAAISMMTRSAATSGGQMPAAVGYVSATRSYEEVSSGLLERQPQAPLADLKFLDLSPVTFLGSNVPHSWVLDGVGGLDELAAMGGSRVIPELAVQFLDSLPDRSAVFLDIVTELMGVERVGWKEMLLLMYGVQRLARKRQHVVCTICDHVALGPERHEQLCTTADGVLTFAWEEVSTYQRQRIMFISSWPGLSFSLEDTSSSKFEVSYSPEAGFEVSTVRQILGR